MTLAEPLVRRGVRLRVRGVVQGVGFRPFLHRLALRHRLGGWVRNAPGEVEVALEGATGEIDRFLFALRAEAPPLAVIDAVEVEEAAPTGVSDFLIEPSTDLPGAPQAVPPDVGICAACHAELTDPANRRYRYPFITCTDCGPRYTLIERLPYDRVRTTMRAFAQCPACAAEYHSPGDRRHHSETNSCAACGPSLWFEATGDAGAPPRQDDAIAAAAALLLSGGVLALRGLGGFHLAVDATSSEAVSLLRQRKQREAKPFAVMVRSVAEAEELAAVAEASARVMQESARPIVLLEARPATPLAPEVAPALGSIGLMLPATPLHELLLEAVDRPLVMTSGNRSEEPIATGNAEARLRLGGIADGFLLHDREILSRTDDSVLRVVEGQTLLFRRARGIAPLPLSLPIPTPVPLLAVGPHLKNTFTLAAAGQAWLSPHIGDLDSLEGLAHFQETLAVYRQLFRMEPEAVVHDLHPGYLSTRLAQELNLPRTLAVQHHHAHIAAVLAEHGVTERVIGVAYDGTGLGSDGAVWGAEVLVADLEGFERVGHLRYAPLPGGDLAAREPWRAALGYASLSPEAHTVLAPVFESIPPAQREMAERQIARGVNCPVASSMGRLFDAAAAILGVRLHSHFEGQAAMELEALAGRRSASEFHLALDQDDHGMAQVDPLPLLIWLARRRLHGADVAGLAADFHESIGRATMLLALRAAELTGLRTVALGGGVFQNVRLLLAVRWRLEQRGLRVLLPRRLPPNDGGISYGQAAIGAARLARA